MRSGRSSIGEEAGSGARHLRGEAARLYVQFDLNSCACSRDRREEISAPHGLDDIVIDAESAQAAKLAGQVVGPEHHYDLRMLGHAADKLLRGIESAQHRHRAVQQDNLKRGVLRAGAVKFG